MATIAAIRRQGAATATIPIRAAIMTGPSSAPALVLPHARVTTGAVVALVSTPFKGFGFVRYAQASSDAPLALSPGVATRLQMTIDPALTLTETRAPFGQFTFWDGAIFRTPNVNDVLDLRIGFNAIAAIAGGKLTIEADLVSGAPLDTAYADLPDQAATSERVYLELTVYSGASFLASGIQFRVTSTVPCTIQGATIVVEPKSSGA